MLQTIIRRIRKEGFLWSALVLAGIIYALISLVNHYCFRTYTLDLGAYTNALYDYAHFSWNDSTSFKPEPENLLADHFDLYLPLLSPLIWIFGTYTLLIVQLAAILFGAVGVYRFAEQRFPSLKKHAVVAFLLFFGIFSALSFDYHSNVVATMFVPWLLLAFARNKIRYIFLWTILMLIAKENIALWLIFIGIGLLWIYRRDKRLRKTALIITGLAAGYFVLITGVVMPLISNTGKYPHFHYSVLGNTSGEALGYLLSHPLESIRLLFVNHSPFSQNDGVKAELWVVFAASGICCLRKPVYLFMLIPVLAQKLYNDQAVMWGITQHYSIEFAPLLVIGTFDSIASFRREKWQKTMGYAAIILFLAGAVRVMDNTIIYAEKARVRLYKAAHYSREFPVDEAYALLKRIPEGAVVSAQSAFVPHLALRPAVYQFPVVRDAQYILLSPVDNAYPLDAESFQKKTDSLVNSPAWKVVLSDKYFLLLKKHNQ